MKTNFLKGLNRRDFLKGIGAAGGLALGTSLMYNKNSMAAAEPKKLILCDLNENAEYLEKSVYEQFEKDYGIKLERAYSPNIDENTTKTLARFSASQQTDATMLKIYDRSRFADGGMLEDLTKMPGMTDYLNDFTEATKKSLSYKGKIWGLPRMQTTLIGVYNEELAQKAGIKKPPKTWEELTDVCLKAKKDKISEYPMVWCAGVGPEQLPYNWYIQSWTRGAPLFDPKTKAPMLGPGSKAREALTWWRKTFLEWKITDPGSVEWRYWPAIKVFILGRHIFNLVAWDGNFRWMSNPKESQIADKVRMMAVPGNGRTFGWTDMFSALTTTVDKDWSWKLVQYLGGKTKAGEYASARSMIIGSAKISYAPGYKSLRESQFFKDIWSKDKVDLNLYREIQTKCDYLGDLIPILDEPWFSHWTNNINVHLQACLTGKITADEACDRIEKQIEQSKRSV